MADYSEDERARLAAAGHALPDGSYPMKTCGDVADARQAYGRAPDSHRGDLVALINRRNRDLNCGQPEFTPAA